MRGVLYGSLSLAVAFVMFSGMLPSGSDPAPPAAAGTFAIQPGDYSWAGNAGCTLSWVYDGLGDLEGRVFIGTAAHCVSSVGQVVNANGNPAFGRVAVMGSACCTATDWALIEVQPEFVGRVDPSVKGHPHVPVGYTRAADTTAGDVLQVSGYGTVLSWSQVSRENRVGYLVFDSPTLYQSHIPTIWGDSGGPIMHFSTGKALGIVSRLNFVGAFEQGPTVEGILAAAADAGFPVELRTVATS